MLSLGFLCAAPPPKSLWEFAGIESQRLKFGAKYPMWWLHDYFWGVVIPPVVSSHFDDSPYLTPVCHVETMSIAIRAKDNGTHPTTCRWTKAYQSDIPKMAHKSNK